MVEMNKSGDGQLTADEAMVLTEKDITVLAPQPPEPKYSPKERCRLAGLYGESIPADCIMVLGYMKAARAHHHGALSRRKCLPEIFELVEAGQYDAAKALALKIVARTARGRYL